MKEWAVLVCIGALAIAGVGLFMETIRTRPASAPTPAEAPPPAAPLEVVGKAKHGDVYYFTYRGRACFLYEGTYSWITSSLHCDDGKEQPTK